MITRPASTHVDYTPLYREAFSFENGQRVVRPHIPYSIDPTLTPELRMEWLDLIQVFIDVYPGRQSKEIDTLDTYELAHLYEVLYAKRKKKRIADEEQLKKDIEAPLTFEALPEAKRCWLIVLINKFLYWLNRKIK